MKRVYVKLKLDHVVLTENSLDKFGVVRKGYAVDQLKAVGISFTYTRKSSGTTICFPEGLLNRLALRKMRLL